MVPAKEFFQRLRHKTSVPARPVFRGQHRLGHQRPEFLESHQVIFCAPAKEKPLAESGAGKVARGKQQRRDADTTRDVQNLIRRFCACQVLFFEESVAKRREQPDFLSSSELRHQAGPTPDDLIEKLDELRPFVL